VDFSSQATSDGMDAKNVTKVERSYVTASSQKAPTNKQRIPAHEFNASDLY
jgi:hypothetical protein